VTLRNFVRVGTGLIYAAIVAAWAAYLVPLWIRRYEEAADASPVAGFVPRARVLVRRRPRVGGGSAAEGARPAGEHNLGSVRGRSPAGQSPASQSPASQSPASQSPASPSPMRRSTAGRASTRQAAARNKAARVATARRRRILVALVGLTVVVGVLGALALAPWWSLVVPTTVVALFLAVSARVARGDRVRRHGRPVSTTAARSTTARSATARSAAIAGRPDSDAASPTDTRGRAADGASIRAHNAARRTDEPRDGRLWATGHLADGSPADRRRADVPGTERAGDGTRAADLGERSGHQVETSAASSGSEAAAEAEAAGWWDPIQVPLPTYLGKAKATRTVRTVDLGERGAWTSGRLPEAEMLTRPDESAAMLLDETETESAPPRTESDPEVPPGDQRKAVGD
jgi:hypothetical protein